MLKRSVCIGCIVLASALSAHGAILVFDSITGSTGAGAESIVTDGPIYSSFSTGANSGMLFSLEVVLKAATADGQIIDVGLYADSSTSPGSLISALGTISDNSLGTNPTDIIVSLASDPDLSSGTRYWIGLSSTGDGKWEFTSDTSGTGVSGQYYDDNGIVSSNSEGPYMMQVALTGNVPEPSTGTLILAGGLALFTARLRRLVSRKT